MGESEVYIKCSQLWGQGGGGGGGKADHAVLGVPASQALQMGKQGLGS